MATDGERRILGFLVALALIGAGARAVGVHRFERTTLGDAPAVQAAGAARALAAQRAAVDSARRSPRASRSRNAKSRSRGAGDARPGETSAGGQASVGRPRAPRGTPARTGTRPSPFPIDVNAATAQELRPCHAWGRPWPDALSSEDRSPAPSSRWTTCVTSVASDQPLCACSTPW